MSLNRIKVKLPTDGFMFKTTIDLGVRYSFYLYANPDGSYDSYLGEVLCITEIDNFDYIIYLEDLYKGQVSFKLSDVYEVLLFD